jgi:hypothetical protein
MARATYLEREYKLSVRETFGTRLTHTTYATVLGVGIFDQFDEGRNDPSANEHVTVRRRHDGQGEKGKSRVYERIWNVYRYKVAYLLGCNCLAVVGVELLTFASRQTLDKLSEVCHQYTM